MTWYDHSWLAGYALPAVVGAGLAWWGLIRTSVGKGRLLGSWRSAGLTFLILALTGALGVVAGLALPHLATLPPAAAGLATGATAYPRKRQGETTQPYVRFMTLGIAWLRERLEYRMHLDALTWCDRFLDGFEKSAQLRVFMYELRNYLLDRHPTAAKTISQLHDAADQAMTRFLDVQTKTDADRHDRQRSSMREATAEEVYACRSAFGEALSHCGDLLRYGYVHGRRTEQAELTTLRAKAMFDDAFRSAPPPQRRRLLLRRNRS